MAHERRPVVALSPAGSSKDPLAARIIGSATSGIFELGIFHPVGTFLCSNPASSPLEKEGCEHRTPEGPPRFLPLSPSYTVAVLDLHRTACRAPCDIHSRHSPRCSGPQAAALSHHINSSVWVKCGRELPTRNTTHPLLFQPPTPPPTPGTHPHTSARGSPRPSLSSPSPPLLLPRPPSHRTSLSQTPSRSGS